MNYFDILGIEEASFDLDAKALDAAFKDRQKRLHPDRFATGTQEERHFSAEQSALVNQAYSRLKEPLPRAVYLLKLLGIEEARGGEGTITDPELLMEVMEARQAVEEAQDADELARLAAENRKQEEQCIQDLAAAFRSKNLARAAQLCTQLRYITRIGEAIRTKQ